MEGENERKIQREAGFPYGAYKQKYAGAFSLGDLRRHIYRGRAYRQIDIASDSAKRPL